MSSPSSLEPAGVIMVVRKSGTALLEQPVPWQQEVRLPVHSDDTTSPITPETRQRMAESARLRCTPEWRAAKSESLRLHLDDCAICAAYKAGATVQEIADAQGVSRKAISNLLDRNGVPRRKAAKRNQWGAANHMWRGNEATLSKMHRRLDRRFGTPQKCDVCGTTDPDRTYDWANLTGHYGDLADYKRMCRSCHWRYDEKHRNFGGRNV